jgi:two-component system, NarL family, sensor kinase
MLKTRAPTFLFSLTYKVLFYSVRKIYFILFLLTAFTDNYGQAIKKDSLLRLLPGIKEDTNKVNLLFSIGEAYESSFPDTARLYLRMSGELSEKLNYTKGIQKFYRRISQVFIIQSAYDSVLYYNTLGLELARRERDTFNIGVSLFNIGIAYRFMSDYENAVYYNLEGAKLLEGKGYTNVESSLYDGLQVLYMSMSQYDKAIDNGVKAVSAGRKLKDKNSLAVALNNLALSYMEVKQEDKAKAVLIEALGVSREIENKSVEGCALNNLADIAIREGNFELLKSYADRSLQIHTDLNSLEGITNSNRALGIYYLYLKNFGKATEYCMVSLTIAKEQNFLLEEAQCLKTLAAIAFARRDVVAGFRYLQAGQKLEGEIFNQSLAQLEAGMKVKYETEQKEITIKELEAEKRTDRLVIEQRNILNFVLAGAVATLLVIFSLAYRNYQQKKKLQQQRISELETEKQLTATEAVLKGEEQERTRLAKDLHDGLGGMLAGIKYSFSTMKGGLIMTPGNQQVFERSMDMLDSSIKEMRRVAHNMMPEALVKFGLDTAVKDFCNDITQSGALRVTYQSIGLVDENFDQTTAITIYRIVQELISNTLKHAAAKIAIVQITKTGQQLAITVEDDGKGFDTTIISQAKGIGWINIQHRVDFLKGKLDINAAPGKGTSVHIEFNV